MRLASAGPFFSPDSSRVIRVDHSLEPPALEPPALEPPAGVVELQSESMKTRRTASIHRATASAIGLVILTVVGCAREASTGNGSATIAGGSPTVGTETDPAPSIESTTAKAGQPASGTAVPGPQVPEQEVPERLDPVRDDPIRDRPTELVAKRDGADAAQRTGASKRDAAPAADESIVRLADGLVVDRDADEVRFAARVVLRDGWLEQIVCTPGTREHEAIFVTEVRPSLIHAALMLLGLEPGSPGSWRMDGDDVVEVAPTGPLLKAIVRYRPLDSDAAHAPDRSARDGAETRAADATPWAGAERHLAELVRDTRTDRSLAAPKWRFSGSLLDDRDRLPAGASRYLADWSGSVVGLVTFGDEVISLPKVRPDQVDVAPAEWMAWTERIPPLGTDVTIVLRPLRDAPVE